MAQLKDLTFKNVSLNDIIFLKGKRYKITDIVPEENGQESQEVETQEENDLKKFTTNGQSILLDNFDDKLKIIQCSNEVQKTKIRFLIPENFSNREKCETEDQLKIPSEFKSRFSKINECNNFSDPSELCTYNKRLDYIPLNTGKNKLNCNKIKQETFWEGMKNYLNELLIKNKDQRTKTIIFISHHHILRKILKLKEKEYRYGIKNGYANCFCLKIEKNNTGIQFDILFKGFPDKKDYHYLGPNEEKLINLDIIRDKLNMVGTNFIMYLGRHGNSMHNKPLSTKIYDSTLTPLGIYQAYILGIKIQQDLEFPNLSNHYFYCFASNLNRSQHTCLTVFWSMFIKWNSIYQNDNQNDNQHLITSPNFIKKFKNVKLFYLFGLFYFISEENFNLVKDGKKKKINKKTEDFEKKYEISDNFKLFSMFNTNTDCINLRDSFQVNNKGGNKFIYIKNVGKRKVRYYKNGKKYVIIKKKKRKINSLI